MSTVTLTPVELVLRVAAASEGACESPPNSNAGPFVARILATTGNRPGDPWCAAWVSSMGVTALGDEWPVLRSASVAAIAKWAADHECRYVAGKVPAARGDLFALWFPSLNRWAHIGFVTGVKDDGSVETLEGNTSGGGSREGWLVARRTRRLTDSDRLIRWMEAMR